MGETIAIIFIFMVIMVFGSLFYARVVRSGTVVKQEESLQQKAIEVAQKVSFLPEIQCSEGNIAIENCIDIFKVDSAADIMSKNRIFYYDNFGFSSITIVKIFPDDDSWLIYENAPEKYTDQKTTFVPISLFEPRTKDFSFGYIKVEVYK